MCNVVRLNKMKRRELAIKKLSLDEFGLAILGFKPYGGYISDIKRYHKMMRNSFSVFWREVGPLAQDGLASKVGV